MLAGSPCSLKRRSLHLTKGASELTELQRFLTCPSCNVQADGTVCRRCGARYRAGAWRYITKTRCRVCAHLNRPLIESALARRIPLRAIAARFGLSRSALSRHQRSHMTARNTGGNAAPNSLPGQSVTSPAKVGLAIVVFGLVVCFALTFPPLNVEGY
jgi:hypothetical protein